jgi:hypothetical protein
MEPQALAIMVVSVGSVLALTIYCLARVFQLPPVEVEETLKAELEIDTQDTQDAD